MDRFEVEDSIRASVSGMSSKELEIAYNSLFEPEIHYNVETGIFEEEE